MAAVVAVIIGIGVSVNKHPDAYFEGGHQGSDWAYSLESGDSIRNYDLNRIAAKRAARNSQIADKSRFIQGFVEGASAGEAKKEYAAEKAVAKTLANIYKD
jgi:hypothetical protein